MVQSLTATQFANMYTAGSYQQTQNFTRQLGSGLRVNNAADDAASLAIGTRLATESASISQASSNLNQATSLLQIADGASQNIGDLLTRATALSVQAGSDNLSDTDRQMLDTEFQNIMKEVDRIAQDSGYGDLRLLSSDQTLEFRAGTGVIPDEDTVSATLSDSSGSALGLTGLSIDTKAGADAALDALTRSGGALDILINNRVEIGASINSLEQAAQNNATTALNTEAARSSALDANIAQAITSYQQSSTQYRLGIESTALQNSSRGMILNLFA